MPDFITVRELARRLCLANHRQDLVHGHPSDSRVPCGTHTAEAERVYFLTVPAGERSWLVIREFREKNSVLV